MPKAKISKEEFKHLSNLSKMYPKKGESERIRGMLSEALDAIQVLDELDTKGVETLDHPTGEVVNVFRKDEIRKSLTQKEALSNAKNAHNGYFIVDSVFEETSDA